MASGAGLSPVEPVTQSSDAHSGVPTFALPQQYRSPEESQ